MLAEGPLAQQRAFIESLVEEVEVIGDDAVLGHTMPLPVAGEVRGTERTLYTSHHIRVQGEPWWS